MVGAYWHIGPELESWPTAGELDHVDWPHGLRAASVFGVVPSRPLNGHTFMGPVERQFFGEGNITVNSVNYSQTGPCLENFYHVNTLFVEVSEPDEDGNMYFGPIGVAWDGRVAGFAHKKIVQINKYQGKVRGRDCCIHVGDVDAICRFDHPLPNWKKSRSVRWTSRFLNIVPRIPDGCTMQIGLGGISNAVAYSLIHHKHIGIHTEMLTDPWSICTTKASSMPTAFWRDLAWAPKRFMTGAIPVSLNWLISLCQQSGNRRSQGELHFYQLLSHGRFDWPGRF